jgi:hypothetical protein
MNKSAILVVITQHFLQLKSIHEYGKSPPRNPGLFGRDQFLTLNTAFGALDSKFTSLSLAARVLQ